MKQAGACEGEAIDLSWSDTEPPGPKAWEPVWSKYLAKLHRGVAEYVCVEGSKVDLLTSDFAAEVEWVKKWKESIGQALLYSILTGRPPMVILLLRGHEHERRYLDRCRMVCRRAGIELRTVETVPRSRPASGVALAMSGAAIGPGLPVAWGQAAQVVPMPGRAG